MNDTQISDWKRFVTKNKWSLLVIATILVVMVTVAIALTAIMKKNDTREGSTTPLAQEFDPNSIMCDNIEGSTSALAAFTEEEIQQLKGELAEAHAALEKANSDYHAEVEAREADRKAIEESGNRAAILVSEKNQLIAELNAKSAELTHKTPPTLDIVKIIGMYEGYGELVTMTYKYEVAEISKQEGNILTNKTILYLIPGTLKIGVNFDEVKNGIKIADNTKTVSVTIPHAYFISNEIDETNVQRYDVARAIFSKVEDKDYLAVATNAKENAARKVQDDGMLEYAQRLAGLEFIGLVEPITSASGYTIEVIYE